MRAARFEAARGSLGAGHSEPVTGRHRLMSSIVKSLRAGLIG